MVQCDENFLNLSGFRWDEDKMMVTAEDRVWDDYIAVRFFLTKLYSY